MKKLHLHNAPSRIRIVLIVFQFVLSFTVNAQTDSMRSQTRYEFERPKSIYFVVQQMMKSNDPSFYFSYINTHQRSKPNPDFRPDELPHSLLEMRLARRFILYRGLESKSFDFMMLTKFTVNFDFVYRIGEKEDPNSKDNPGLPLNTKFGFTLFEHAFLFNKWRDYRKKERYEAQKDFSTNNVSKKLFNEGTLRMIVPRLDLMHYSNGQDTGAVVYISSTKYRNDYISGNFSTNYTHLQVSYIELTRNNRMLNLTAGLRNDFKIGDWLSFEEKQKDRYGKLRLNTSVQYRTGPVNLFWIRISDREFFEAKRNRKEVKRKIKLLEQKQLTIPDSLQQRATRQEADPNRKRMVKGLFDVAFTFSSEHILDQTSKLPNNRSNIEISLDVIPLYWETMGFMFSVFRGRDYLNIRYDLPVTIVKAGFTFQLGHYRPTDAAIARKYN